MEPSLRSPEMRELINKVAHAPSVAGRSTSQSHTQGLYPLCADHQQGMSLRGSYPADCVEIAWQTVSLFVDLCISPCSVQYIAIRFRSPAPRPGDSTKGAP